MACRRIMVLLIYILLDMALITVMGNMCHFLSTFSCTVQVEELPDETMGRACVCVSADCIPRTNPCRTISRIKLKDAKFDLIPTNSFSNYSRLISLDIQISKVSYIQAMAFYSQENLKLLRIAGQKIQLETGAFYNLKRLENLQFQPNFTFLSGKVFVGVGSTLKNLDLGSGMVMQLHNNTFDKFINLKILSIANNKLNIIKRHWLSRLTELEEINLSGNFIQLIPTSVFSHQVKLKRLYLPENDITLLEQGCFNGLESLEELILSGNRIRYIDTSFTNLKNLTKLVINDNFLTVITTEMFAGLTSLKQLSLTGNSIGSIIKESLQLQNLEILDLSRNVIESLDRYYFQDIQKAFHINLGFNKIKEISNGTFSNLTALKYLFLENNQLATFSFYDFGTGNKLQRLSLQNNILTSISFSTSFQPPPLMYLDILWLENNNLTTFPSVIFDYAPGLAINRNSLQLTNNPLNCDCNIKGLSESRRNIILDVQIRSDCLEPTCSVPTAILNYGDIAVQVDEKISLICKVTGQPNPLVSWTYNNDAVIRGWYNIITGTSQISTENFGNYTCTATNIIGSSSTTIKLIKKAEVGSNQDAENDTSDSTCHTPSVITCCNIAFLTIVVTTIFNSRVMKN